MIGWLVTGALTLGAVLGGTGTLSALVLARLIQDRRDARRAGVL